MSESLQVGSVNLDDALDGFDNAQASGGGNYFRPGSYIVKSKNNEVKKGFKGISFIGTTEIVKVLRNDNDESNPEGSDANIVENLTTNKTMAQSNIKAFLLALAGGKKQAILDAKQIKKEFIPVCVSAAQPLREVLCFVEAITKKREGKSDITVKNWRVAMNGELEKYGLKQPGT